MGQVVAEQVGPSDVVRIGGARGKKAVIIHVGKVPAGRGLTFRTLVGGATPIVSDTADGYISLRSGERIVLLGTWRGKLNPGSKGKIDQSNGEGESPQKGSDRMATRTAAKRGTKKTSGSKSKSTAGSKSQTEGKTRASDEELDKLAARVVKMRDDQGKSWGEIEEALEINPSRLRALYNRGGGEPTGARAGGGKKSSGKSGAKTAGKKSGSSRRKKADPSDED
jgi:hypothetical protein